MNRRARVALQALKLIVYIALAVARTQAADCTNKCGQTYITDGAKGTCHCDYWCNNRDDCCGGTASKDAACPNLRPTTNKEQLTQCQAGESKGAPGSPAYKPGMCWCDDRCSAAGDCCPNAPARQQPSSASSRKRTAGAQPSAIKASDPALAAQLEAEVRAAAIVSGAVHDCGAVKHLPPGMNSFEDAAFSVASASARGMAGPRHMTLVEAEQRMLDCQAADQGPPAEPFIIPIHWTAGRVCKGRRRGANSGSARCTGGEYPASLVHEQIAYVNALYAHAGIQFTWDGVIHRATASSVKDINVCLDPFGQCWVCGVERHGDEVSINVVTSPVHLGNSALGVTIYPSYIQSGDLPMCANWVFMYEKTLPNQGGRSLVDNELSDSGAVLAHEIGHQLMLHHTWYEEAGLPNKPPVKHQCQKSASMDAVDVLAARSDGVRDTPAQSLNGTKNSVTDILRFIHCDADTGHYANTTAFAQQSCTEENGYAHGEGYYNNYNNLMSYGDRTCLRTLTPGQGARARCGLRCMRRGQC